MTNPVTSTPSISSQNITPATISAPTPGGIGTQPTSLSSAQSSASCSSSLWGSLSHLVSSAVEGIRSFIGSIFGWFLGSTSSQETAESAAQWQLPPETQPISQTGQLPAETQPISQPAPLPAETQPIPQPAEQDPFAALALNDVERQKIFDIFHTLGTCFASLPFHMFRLNRLGAEVDHVHPFKLLEYLCKHPTLVQDLDAMRGNSIAWGGFVNGLSGKMVRDIATIPSSKSGFARSMNVSLADLDPFLLTRNWEGMALFILDVKHGRRTSVWVEPAPTIIPSPVTTTVEPPPTVIPSPVTTTVEPPPTIISPPVTTTAEEPIPPPLAQIADLPFDSGDEEILTELFSKYLQNSRWRLVYEHYSLQLLWSHLSARHSLKILSHLYSKPKLMNELDTIFQYYGTRVLFLRALSAELAKTSFVEVRPYIENFANTCHLDPIQVKRQIKDGQWNLLVEHLLQSYQANPPI